MSTVGRPPRAVEAGRRVSPASVALRLRSAPMVRPLAIRDFALLWAGMTVSLLGDGITTVAIAWQVYSLSNVPTALALVGAALVAPQIVLLLLGGALSDRFDRRHMLMLSDMIRGSAIAALGVLSVLGVLRLWHVFALIALYGAGAALFTPAFTGIVRDVVPRDLLLQANSLGQFVRPLCVRFLGPALGGVLIAALGTGEAFLFDAASFAFSATAFLLMRTRSLRDGGREQRSIGRDVLEGIRYVIPQTWLWGTFLAVTIAMFLFLGPVYVLMPFVVKNELGGGAEGLGLVFSAGGIGAIAAALTIGHRGLPRRPLTLVYVAWSLAGFSLVGYALATAVWQAMLVSLASVAALTAGGIIWTTLLQRLVPGRMIDRVSSLDWLLSIGLAPISYALTGPVSNLLGVHATLLGAGIMSGAVLLLFLLLLPGLRGAEPAGPEPLAAS